jgi:hypothetical protein
MLADRINTGDAAHIAEEIVNDAGFAMRSKCISVYGVVSDKIVSLENALELYQVPHEVYVDFLAKKQAEEVEDQSVHSSFKETMIFRIHLYEKIFEHTFSSLNRAHVQKMLKLLKQYSKEIEEDKLVLKE